MVFDLDGRKVDLAVALDRANDTVAIFEIDATARRLIDITSADVAATICRVDDGEATVFGLATYRSPETGREFASLTQADGAKVAILHFLAMASSPPMSFACWICPW